MIFAALSEAAERGELILAQDGFCRYHRRRDGIVVIREVIVLPFRRRTGLGRRLVEQVQERHPKDPLLAKCPASYESNGFWKAMGFEFRGESNGVNSWWRHLSSTVQTAIQPSPERQ